MKLTNFKNALGTPYFETDSILIYNMDCKEGINAIKNSGYRIDCTITSPPYNIGKEYENKMDITEYRDWLASIVNGIYDITSDVGAFLLNVGYLEVTHRGKAVPITYLLWDHIKFYLIQEIIWNYGAGVACKRMLSPRNEKILWYVKNAHSYTFNLDEIRDPDVKYPNQKKNGKLRCNTLGKNPSDVWQIAKVTSGENRSSVERTDHPAQFPTDLIDRMVKGFTNPEDIILDPFIGSGTTAVSCMNNGRKCIGFEIREDYCDIICDRLDQAYEEKREQESILSLF
ncbi:MAG: site-specific DNA-methyltransferase [Desulfitobacterium hafniense]|nr:site-specific DNA-methyltransferase [Desulfitobacterium hafniense]